MKYFIHILLIIGLVSCIRPIMISVFNFTAITYPVYGGNSEHNYFVPENKPSDLKFEWESSTHGSFTNTSFLAYDTLLFVPDLGGRVASFDINNGKKIGELKYSGGIEQSAILLKTFLIFIVNEKKENFSSLVVYDIVNGKELRTTELKGKFGNEILVVDDYIYAVSDFGLIYKFTQWGTVEWEKDIEQYTYSNPAADSTNLFIATIEGEILKVDLEDGNIIDNWEIGNGFESGICIKNNSLLIGDNKGIFYSVNKNNGSINWQNDSKTKIVQTPGLDNENVYYGNLSGKFYSANIKTGDINWINETSELVNTTPLVFENIIIQPNLFKYLDIIDKKTGETLNSIDFDTRCRTTPIYFQEKIFFGVDKGEVFCYSFEE